MALIFVKQASSRVVSEETKSQMAATKRANQIDLKYSVQGKDERNEKFIISSKQFEELGLQEKGLFSVYDDGLDENGQLAKEKTNYLCVVEEKVAVFLKGNRGAKKGRTFTSTNLRDNLIAQGVITADMPIGETVKFDMVPSTLEAIGLEEGNDQGFLKVFELVKSEDQSKDSDEKDEDDENEKPTSDTDVNPTDETKASGRGKKEAKEEEYA